MATPKKTVQAGRDYYDHVEGTIISGSSDIHSQETVQSSATALAANVHGDSSVDDLVLLLTEVQHEIASLNLPEHVIEPVADGVAAARRRLDANTPNLLETSTYLKQVVDDLKQGGYSGTQAIALGTVLGKIILWCDGYLL